jgi:AcrR family transcriptional regulator
MTETKQKILAIAENFFLSKGFNAVSLEDICGEISIRPSSLYYHFPEGKEQIYTEVIKYRIQDFKKNLDYLTTKFETLEDILKNYGYWYIAQKPMNMLLIAEMDMPYLTPRSQKIVMDFVGENLFAPMSLLFEKFRPLYREHLRSDLLVSTFNLLLFSIHSSAKMGGLDKKTLVDANVQLFLYGIIKQTKNP